MIYQYIKVKSGRELNCKIARAMIIAMTSDYRHKQILSQAISSKNALNTNNSGTKTGANDAIIDVTIRGESLTHYEFHFGRYPYFLYLSLLCYGLEYSSLFLC